MRNSLSASLGQLRKVVADFGDIAVTEKLKLLKAIEGEKLTSPKSIIDLHSLLLYMLAYPQSKSQHLIAQKELRRCANAAEEIFSGSNFRKQNLLVNSGIAHSPINVSFSFDFVQWLLKNHKKNVTLFSIDADAETVEHVISACLPSSARDLILHKMLPVKSMIQILKLENEDSLDYLVRLLANAECSLQIRDELWDSLKIFVTWKLDDSAPSITNAKSIKRKVFYHHKGLLKKFDGNKEILKPLKKPYKLDRSEKEQLLNSGRGVLAMLLRETDPLTYADINEIELFDMGRGIDIALYPMISERRLAFKSYIGYVAFKNQIPVAYGGGWIFMHRSKIGINVFPNFRRGESAFLFCQILRLYSLHYNVKKFIVEPYQFGKRNTEGLKSGAYWFYYRFGFRSVSEKWKKIAEAEFIKIVSDKNYKTPITVLRQFTNSNLELYLSEKDFPDVNPLIFSQIVNDISQIGNLKEDELALLRSLPLLKRKISERAFNQRLQNNKVLIKLIDKIAMLN